jgi:5'-deoxynucleotidase YfbR-like HD superfamily hydrolase
MNYRSEDIFTPQGRLEEVEHRPNLDFLMNLFNIPRAFGVSGFGGNWNVGMHSFAAAMIAFLWSRFNGFSAEKRDRLVALALVHDLHEAATGDILPMFKTPEVKRQLDTLQTNILQALGTEADTTLAVDLKVIDLIAFLYEITQVSPSILHDKKLALAQAIADKQRTILFSYARDNDIEQERIERFLEMLDV